MAPWYQNEFLHASPLFLLAVIPILSAVCGLRISKLKSPINFQQGTISSSPWRIALSMAIVAQPPFAFWCLLSPGMSGLFYVVGALLAMLFVSLTVTNILHYIPSPSIFHYLKLRFQSELLQHLCAGIQLIISIVLLFCYLMFTSSLLNAISKFPFYLLAPLVASLCLLTLVFAGQTMVMLPVFFIFFAALAAGSSIFVYFGLEHVKNFGEIVSFEFGVRSSLGGFFVGFLLTFFQLAAGATMYQLYFSLSTRRKLRVAFALHAAFFLFLSLFVFIITGLFVHFLESHCQLQFSANSLLEFIWHTVPHAPFLSFVVAVSLALLLMFTYEWTFVAAVSTLWEEFLKPRFKDWPIAQQLCALQAAALKLSIVLIIIALGIGLSPVSYAKYLPFVFYVVLGLTSLSTACFVCGYFLPCTNYKGCVSALCVSGFTLLFAYVEQRLYQPLPSLQNNCTAFVEVDSKIGVARISGGWLNVLPQIPLEFLPLLLILFFIFICVIVSALFGWQDLFAIDWNLIVWPCCLTSSMTAKSYRKRRPFVESDSFRYAAQNGGVDTLSLP